MSVNIEGFRRAMQAALDGPSIKDVEWSSFGHDFNVKKVAIKKTSDGIEINGNEGHHISHRLRWRPDDQMYYSCKVTREGKVEDLKVNIKTSWETLGSWFETAGKIIGVAAIIAGKADQTTALEPTPSSIELLDGGWEGDAEFLIANIISVAAVRAMPEIGKIPAPDFSRMTMVVNPTIVARFHDRRRQLADQ